MKEGLEDWEEVNEEMDGYGHEWHGWHGHWLTPEWRGSTGWSVQVFGFRIGFIVLLFWVWVCILRSERLIRIRDVFDQEFCTGVLQSLFLHYAHENGRLYRHARKTIDKASDMAA